MLAAARSPSAGSVTGPDWVDALEPPFLPAFCRQLRSLPLARLGRYPPPKQAGLPFGREGRILRRFLTGGSSLLDPSALSRAYLTLATRGEQLVFRGLVLGEPLSAAEWSELLGGEALTAWRERALLASRPGGALASAFRLFRTGGITVIADPVAPTYEQSFENRVHIGQDTLNLLEFLQARVDAKGSRVLEVGPGTGLILLALAAGRKQVLGVDINPRAVRLARVNAELNDLRDVRIEQGDIFAPVTALPRFDLVYWNTPLLFLPEAERTRSVDGFGGHLGIELSIRFIEQLPALLDEGGLGVVAALPPVLDDGGRPLDQELRRISAELGLELVEHVTQRTWLPELRAFHRQFSIDHFENVFIEVRRGGGGFRRVPPGPWQRVIDLGRARLYARGG